MTASARWRRLVRSRLAEMERLAPGRGAMGPGYWTATRARRYAASVGRVDEKDPLLSRLRSEVGPGASVLDVGAGTGRFTLALAPLVREVTAVDPSPAMLKVLTREVRRLGITNVVCVTGGWQEVDTAPADFSVCSYVLPLVENADTFLSKLNRATRRRAFLYLNAAGADLVLDPLWRHFHGTPRRPSPTYLDAVAVLAELDLAPEVVVAEVPLRSNFANLGAAVKSYQDQLLLPDDPLVRRELRSILSSWLVTDHGALRPPLRTWPAAIVSWRPNLDQTD